MNKNRYFTINSLPNSDTVTRNGNILEEAQSSLVNKTRHKVFSGPPIHEMPVNETVHVINETSGDLRIVERHVSETCSPPLTTALYERNRSAIVNVKPDGDDTISLEASSTEKVFKRQETGRIAMVTPQDMRVLQEKYLEFIKQWYNHCKEKITSECVARETNRGDMRDQRPNKASEESLVSNHCAVVPGTFAKVIDLSMVRHVGEMTAIPLYRLIGTAHKKFSAKRIGNCREIIRMSRSQMVSVTEERYSVPDDDPESDQGDNIVNDSSLALCRCSEETSYISSFWRH